MQHIHHTPPSLRAAITAAAPLRPLQRTQQRINCRAVLFICHGSRFCFAGDLCGHRADLSCSSSYPSSDRQISGPRSASSRSQAARDRKSLMRACGRHTVVTDDRAAGVRQTLHSEQSSVECCRCHSDAQANTHPSKQSGRVYF